MRITNPRICLGVAVLAALALLSSGLPGAPDSDGARSFVKAARRGGPTVRLEDSVQAPRLRGAGGGHSKALSMATADFDEDGAPDLVAGYDVQGRGLLVLYRGNVDAVFPNSPEAKRRNRPEPFLPDPQQFNTEAVPQLIGAGDFDADGHWDLVMAAVGTHSLVYLLGDGRGGFGQPRDVEMDGPVTALLAADVNRPDGLTDVVVAIGSREPKVLVFESAGGAMNAEPEAISIPETATALSAGLLDGDGHYDIAVGSGRSLSVIHGRDRRLSQNAAIGSNVAEARVSREAFQYGVRSLAIGDFSGDGSTEVAVFSDLGSVHVLNSAGGPDKDGRFAERRRVVGRFGLPEAGSSGVPLMVAADVSSRPGSDLLVLDAGNRMIHLLEPGEAHGPNVDPVSLDVEGAVAAVLPMRLNADALSDLVVLHQADLAPSVVRTAATPLVVTNTNDTGPGSLRDAVNAANFVADADTIVFNIPGTGPFNINVVGLNLQLTFPVTIDGTTQPGYSGTPLIDITGRFHFLGGTSVLRGVAIHSPGSGGLYPEAVVLGREFGNTVQLTNGGNRVEGNYIGLRADGTTLGPQQAQGVFVSSPNNVVGGTTAAARNVISGSASRDGVLVMATSTVAPTGNLIQGNYIGTDATGTLARPNANNGARIIGANNNVIGGTTAGSGNLLSGNTEGGARIETNAGTLAANNNLIQGNLIGTDPTGTSAVSNMEGVIVRPAGFPSLEMTGNTIGGTTPAARNVISGNRQRGVWLSWTNTINNAVQGNYIGTKVDGVAALGNGTTGTPSAPKDGVHFDGQGAGATSPSGNLIGGAAAGAGNVIAFNFGSGVNVRETADAQITGNQIHSNAVGVLLGTFGFRAKVSANSIYSNGGLGIDIVLAGPTLGPNTNDACDTDTGLGNQQQNYPVLTFAGSGGGVTQVKGSLNSAPNTAFTLEFFSSSTADASGFGEGQTYLGSAVVTTSGTCVADFSAGITIPTPVPIGHVISATATDPAGNTSEFSAVRTVVALNQAPVAVNDNFTANEDTTLNVSAPGVLGNDSDPDGNPITVAVVSGPGYGVLVLNPNGSFTYSPNANFNGIDSFTYKATDGSLDSNIATVTITINPVNDAPVATSDSYSVNEDSVLTVPAPGVLSNDTDVDGNALTAVLVTGPAHGTLTLNGNGSFTYTPAANYNGSDSFTYKASDGTADSNIVTVSITVIPVNDAPVAVNDAFSVNAGAALTVSAPGVLGNDSDIDGNTLSAVLVAGPTGGVLVLNGNGSFTYTPNVAFSGIDSFTYRASDGIATSNIATVNITVLATNRPPVVSTNGPYTVNEGSVATLSATGSDPDGDALVFSWDLNNDGVFETPGQSAAFNAADGPAAITVRVRACDASAACATASTSVSVLNVAPAVTITGPAAGAIYPAGTAVTFSGTFADPGADSFTGRWQFDTITVPAVITPGPGGGTAAATYTFSTPGVYQVILTVTDDDGGVGSANSIGGLAAYVVIYDPNGGYVTGGGWFNSPAGAFSAQPGVTGRATFGLVSRYENGATVPSGNTRFQFRAADLSFESDTYEWLVVAGARAQYKGIGSINGTGGYRFLVTAIDGDLPGGGGQDRIRVKIWAASGGVIYDNQPGVDEDTDAATAIGGGSIVIHR